YTDLRYFRADKNMLDIALGSKTDHRVLTGRILTGDRFITHEEATYLFNMKKELGGDAVEMEGAAVAQVCTLHQTPFLIIRTISDKANADSPFDFPRFLPTVVHNSVTIIRHLLENMEKENAQ
ncbi:MAG: 5'-methylthioadenosine/S-adenosylhomocysteine nucleosidase, partial [Bacteroidota bacterium]